MVFGWLRISLDFGSMCRLFLDGFLMFWGRLWMPVPWMLIDFELI